MTCRSILLLLAACGAAGCASYDGRGLVPGHSTAADVEALLGPPAERLALAGGDRVWFYPRQPYGMQTYAVHLTATGIVRSVEQRLTEQNVGRIVPGSSTRREVRELLGPPFVVAVMPRQRREVWTWRMESAERLAHHLHVQFADNGVVREVLMLRDVQNEVGADRD